MHLEACVVHAAYGCTSEAFAFKVDGVFHFGCHRS